MKYNKVRGILRARNGSQIPKFLNPPGALPKLTFPSLNTNLSSGVSYLNNPHLIGSETATLGKTLDISNLNMSDLKAQTKPITLTMPVFLQSLKKFGNKVGNFSKNVAAKAGEFIELNPEMVSRGLQLGSNVLFNSVDNGKGFTGVNAGLGVGTLLANSAGMAGLGLGLSGILFGLNAINKLGSKTLRDFSVDLNVRANLGGSYSGAYSTIDKGAENSGKELGFFTRKKPYEEAISEAESLQNQLININKEAEDRRGRINDLNYLNYNFLLNGGYDLRYMRAKSGGKLLSKIDLLKERKKSLNSIINVLTQEWEPVIYDVELFKEGGSIDWEPIIEDLWEPVIVESYQNGAELYPKEYLYFKNSLPDNLKNTPESEYRTYLYWQAWGKPKDFNYTLSHPNEDGEYMYNWDESDKSYHGNSIAWMDGIGYFIKPKHHSTLKYELDYYNKGLITEEGGKQRNPNEEELKAWKEFRNNYSLEDDGNFYKYVPKFLTNYQVGGKLRTLEELIEYAKKENPRFIQRLSEEPKGIKFIDDEGNEAEGSHYLEWSTDEDGNAIIYPRIQEVEDNALKFFTSNEAYNRAVKNNNILKMSLDEANTFFAEDKEYQTAYKRGWPNFFKKFTKGGNIKEMSKVEETNQKNLIPEGALHKNKHHMEHTEGLTLKGIPVIDNSGELQAEIECDEIVFSLEVTKFLEERYHKYYSEELTKKDKDLLAIEVGKELVYQILHNTDDRTDLISKCKEGGKL